MSLKISFSTLLVCAAACFALGACSKRMDARDDEQKDPNYRIGKRRLETQDYRGAAEAFERAIEANPRSAAAHYELGLLYYGELGEWAAAIYHLEKYARLDPKSHRLDSLNRMIAGAKQELAKGLPLTALDDRLARELANLERLSRENQDLKAQLAQLEQARAPSGSRAAAPATPSSVAPEGRVQPASQFPPAAEKSFVSQPPLHVAAATQTASRTHTVKPGENPYAIARQYGIPLRSLLNANPSIEPHRIRPGQVMAVPSQ